MSSYSEQKVNSLKIDSIIPESGKLFFEQNPEYLYCKPELLPLKSMTLEKLERMQKQAREQLRLKTAAAKEF